MFSNYLNAVGPLLLPGAEFTIFFETKKQMVPKTGAANTSIV
jgi:hypothetical protein